MTTLLMSIGFSLSASNVSANVDSVFFAHPSKAKEIGHSFSTTQTISKKELLDISKYLDDQKKNKSAAAGIATTILSTPLGAYASIPAGVAVSALTSYSQTNADLVSNKLKVSSDKTFKVKISYKYRQAGSNQGYYMISNVKIY